MNYESVPPDDKNFNRVEDLLKYVKMTNCPYSRAQAMAHWGSVFIQLVPPLGQTGDQGGQRDGSITLQ